MGRIVRVNVGYTVKLANGNTYTGPNEVTLTDVQYLQTRPSAFTYGILTDLGDDGMGGGGGPTVGFYPHDQATAAAVWHVVHLLGFHPNVTTVDSTGQEIEGTVTHIDTDSLDIDFNGVEVGGKAYCS